MQGIQKRCGVWLLAICALLLCGAGIRTRAGDKPGAKPLRFVVYGDTRDGHAMHRTIVARVLAAKPDFVIQTGDLVAFGGDADLWKIFDDITGEMRRKIPYYPARGNHDLGGKGYEDRMTAPFASGNKLYYSFDKGDCHFVSVDCYTAYNSGSVQYQWLEKDLAAHQKAAFRFVYFHEPPYSIGSHGSNPTIRAALCPLFKKHHVQIVFNGHDHNYYHTKRDGVTYIVSGGGGAPLYPCFPEKGAIEGDKYESVNHFLACEVNGDKAQITAVRADGSKIEAFTVSAK